MPYKSEAKRKRFHAMLARGEISKKTVDEWDRESRDKELPEKARSRPKSSHKAKRHKK